MFQSQQAFVNKVNKLKLVRNGLRSSSFNINGYCCECLLNIYSSVSETVHAIVYVVQKER